MNISLHQTPVLTFNVDLWVGRIVRLGVDANEKEFSFVEQFLSLHCDHHAFELMLHGQHHVHYNDAQRRAFIRTATDVLTLSWVWG